MKLVINLLCAAYLAVETFCDEFIVDSPAGKFKGHLLKTKNGRDVLSFEGIPYAKPPVDELRFKGPVKIVRLKGTQDATKSVKCYQPKDNANIRRVSTYVGSEDCLYLNVHVPKVSNDSSKLPVLFWIHGGGFLMGSGDTEWNGPTLLLDKDMILVTPNYRLGPFGFLSTGDNVMRGNYGLKDQVMALKWVRDNIESFRGDPKSVTIGGQSAGGTSASLLMHTPMSRGLFQKVIAQSASASSSYALKSWKDAKNQTMEIAELLDCPMKSDLLFKCLQKKPMREIQEASMAIQPNDILGVMHMSPVIEDGSPDAFLTTKSLKESRKMPLMTGVTNQEGIVPYIGLLSSYKDKGLPALRKDLHEMIPWWTFKSNLKTKEQFTKELENIYFGKGGTKEATHQQIVNIISDNLATYGVLNMAKRGKGPTFLYMLSYKGKNNIPQDTLPAGLEDSVSHGEDLLYLFNATLFFPNKQWTKEDLKMSENMVDMWYNFIKFGHPTADGNWKESEGGVRYLDMTNKGFIMKTKMFNQRMSSLDQLYKKYK